MWKEAQNVRRRRSERSWCPINPDTELKLTSRTMFIADFNDVGDICMVNGILRKHKYHQILQACFNVREKAVWKIVYKHFFDLCKLHLKKMRKPR